MKQSDPLALLEEGTLARPGPIGRLVRLLLGLACLYALYELILYRQDIIQTPLSVLPNIAVMVLATLLLINYVANIGFGTSWGRWPSYVAIGSTLLLAVIAWFMFGTTNHALPGTVLWAWMVYCFAHLGLSFVLSAMLATPGCEMRAIPELFGSLSGRAAAEHHCPIAFIGRIDAWESERRSVKY